MQPDVSKASLTHVLFPFSFLALLPCCSPDVLSVRILMLIFCAASALLTDFSWTILQRLCGSCSDGVELTFFLWQYYYCFNPLKWIGVLANQKGTWRNAAISSWVMSFIDGCGSDLQFPRVSSRCLVCLSHCSCPTRHRQLCRIKASTISHVQWWTLLMMCLVLVASYTFLGGGFKYFLFSSLFGEDSHFD